MTTDELADAVIRQAKSCKLTIATAESCTAGAIAHVLSQVKGAGEHFHGGFVTYTKDMKTQVLGVPAELLARKSAVCAEVAQAMAQGALRHSPADVALAITGVLGPDPDEDGNPVGLVYVAAARRGADTAFVKELNLGKIDPADIMQQGMDEALRLLLEICR